MWSHIFTFMKTLNYLNTIKAGVDSLFSSFYFQVILLNVLTYFMYWHHFDSEMHVFHWVDFIFLSVFGGVSARATFDFAEKYELRKVRLAILGFVLGPIVMLVLGLSYYDSTRK